MISKGREVPRPSESQVPSTRQVPGYNSAQLRVGRLGDGRGQGRFVPSHAIREFQPDILTISSSQLG